MSSLSAKKKKTPPRTRPGRSDFEAFSRDSKFNAFRTGLTGPHNGLWALLPEGPAVVPGPLARLPIKAKAPPDAIVDILKGFFPEYLAQLDARPDLASAILGWERGGRITIAAKVACLSWFAFTCLALRDDTITAFYLSADDLYDAAVACMSRTITFLQMDKSGGGGFDCPRPTDTGPSSMALPNFPSPKALAGYFFNFHKAEANRLPSIFSVAFLQYVQQFTSLARNPGRQAAFAAWHRPRGFGPDVEWEAMDPDPPTAAAAPAAAGAAGGATGGAARVTVSGTPAAVHNRPPIGSPTRPAWPGRPPPAGPLGERATANLLSAEIIDGSGVEESKGPSSAASGSTSLRGSHPSHSVFSQPNVSLTNVSGDATISFQSPPTATAAPMPNDIAAAVARGRAAVTASLIPQPDQRLSPAAASAALSASQLSHLDVTDAHGLGPRFASLIVTGSEDVLRAFLDIAHGFAFNYVQHGPLPGSFDKVTDFHAAVMHTVAEMGMTLSPGDGVARRLLFHPGPPAPSCVVATDVRAGSAPGSAPAPPDVDTLFQQLRGPAKAAAGTAPRTLARDSPAALAAEFRERSCTTLQVARLILVMMSPEDPDALAAARAAHVPERLLALRFDAAYMYHYLRRPDPGVKVPSAGLIAAIRQLQPAAAWVRGEGGALLDFLEHANGELRFGAATPLSWNDFLRLRIGRSPRNDRFSPSPLTCDNKFLEEAFVKRYADLLTKFIFPDGPAPIQGVPDFFHPSFITVGGVTRDPEQCGPSCWQLHIDVLAHIFGAESPVVVHTTSYIQAEYARFPLTRLPGGIACGDRARSILRFVFQSIMQHFSDTRERMVAEHAAPFGHVDTGAYGDNSGDPLLLALARSLPAIQDSLAAMAARLDRIERGRTAAAPRSPAAAAPPLPVTPPRPAGPPVPPAAPQCSAPGPFAQGVGGYPSIYPNWPVGFGQVGYGRGVSQGFNDHVPPPPPTPPPAPAATPSDTTSLGHPMKPPAGSAICYPFMNFRRGSPLLPYMNDWYEQRHKHGIPWHTCPNWLAAGCPDTPCPSVGDERAICCPPFRPNFLAISHPAGVAERVAAFRSSSPSVKEILEYVKAHPLTHSNRAYAPKA